MADKKATHTCVKPYRTFEHNEAGVPVQTAEYVYGDPVTDPDKKALDRKWVKAGYKEPK